MSTTTTITPKPSTTVYELKDDDHLTLIGAQDTVLYKRKIFDANKNPVDVQSLLFKNKSYYDLQAYLSVGLGLETKTAKEFYEKIPRADLHDLEKLDDNIYNQTVDFICDIFKHCDDFNKDGNQSFVPVCQALITYERSVQFNINEPDMLRDQIGYLTDPVNSASTDPAVVQTFKDAQDVSQAILLDLAEQAVKTQVPVEGLRKKLVAFRNTTVTDQERMKFLHQQYSTGPIVDRNQPIPNPDYVKDSDDPAKQLPAKGYKQKTIPNPWYEKDKTEDDSNRKYVKCYGDCLQHSLATARQEACDLMDQYNRDFDEWKHDTIVAATSVSYGWIYPLGSIACIVVGSVYTAKAVEAREAYDKHKGEYEKKHDQQIALSSAVDLVMHITRTNDSILAVINEAIAACDKINKAFSDIGIELQTMAASFDSGKGKVTSKALAVRKLATKQLDRAVLSWKEIAKCCQAFIDVDSVLHWEKSTGSSGFITLQPMSHAYGIAFDRTPKIFEIMSSALLLSRLDILRRISNLVTQGWSWQVTNSATTPAGGKPEYINRENFDQGIEIPAFKTRISGHTSLVIQLSGNHTDPLAEVGKAFIDAHPDSECVFEQSVPLVHVQVSHIQRFHLRLVLAVDQRLKRWTVTVDPVSVMPELDTGGRGLTRLQSTNLKPDAMEALRTRPHDKFGVFKSSKLSGFLNMPIGDEAAAAIGPEQCTPSWEELEKMISQLNELFKDIATSD